MKQLWAWMLILLLAGFCLSAQAEEEHEHFIHYQGYDADAHYFCLLLPPVVLILIVR